MDSPRPGVVTINSRQARRASTVWGIPNLANRLLQVGLLSSIASRPLSPATSAFAVSISFCAFILPCFISSCGLGTDRSSRLEPAQRVPLLRFRKVFDLHMHKMGGDLGQFPQKF